MINLTIIKEWIEALRSGEYQQGKYSLKINEDIYCCLGVLCDKVKPKEWKQREGEEYIIYDEKETLPIEIREILEVEGRGGNFYINSENTELRKILQGVDCDDYEYFELAELNDDYGLTFDQIADILEAEFF